MDVMVGVQACSCSTSAGARVLAHLCSVAKEQASLWRREACSCLPCVAPTLGSIGMRPKNGKPCRQRKGAQIDHCAALCRIASEPEGAWRHVHLVHSHTGEQTKSGPVMDMADIQPSTQPNIQTPVRSPAARHRCQERSACM